MVDAKDGADVHTGVDVAAAVKWIKYDAVFALVLFIDENSINQLLRHQHGCLAGRTQRIDHDVVGKNIELLLLLTLDIGLASEADPFSYQNQYPGVRDKAPRTG